MHKAKSHGEIPSLKNVDTTANRSHLQPGEGHCPHACVVQSTEGSVVADDPAYYGEIGRCPMNSTNRVHWEGGVALGLCCHVVFADETCHDEVLPTRAH